MITLETLIITTNKTKQDIIKMFEFLNIQSPAIVCNQTNEIEDYEIVFKDSKVRVHSYTDKGVSKNRNVAASLATADILLFSDDDTPLVDNYPAIVLNAFNNNQKAEVYVFSRTSHDPQFDNHFYKNKKVKFFSEIGTLGGSGIAIKKEAWKKYNLSFNENFGAPNYLCLGEDSLFGKELLNKKVNVYSSSIVLFDVPLNHEKSSYFNNYDERYFVSMGAVGYLLHPHLWRIYFIYKSFIWKKRIGRSISLTYKQLKIGLQKVKKEKLI